MGQIIAIHSFRGGTGKSNITANLAVALASEGYRVGIVDTDVQSPGIHTLFELKKEELAYTLNHYLFARRRIDEVAHDVGARLGLSGALYLVPASMEISQISQVLKEGYNVTLLNAGLREMVSSLNLDYLLIDTHPGINEETLLSIGIANQVLVVMRPDRQDYEGTSITITVARKLGAQPVLVINMLPPIFDEGDVANTAGQTYGVPVWAVIPHSQEVLNNGSSKLIYLSNPDHIFSRRIGQIYRELSRVDALALR
jgi:septum site-determining protein MinD